jgi:hypothetical protein
MTPFRTISGKYRNIFFSEAIALIEPNLCINHWKVLYKLCVFYVDRNSIALYEYLGTYDLPSTDKVRTNPKVIQQIKEDHRKPKFMTMINQFAPQKR